MLDFMFRELVRMEDWSSYDSMAYNTLYMVKVKLNKSVKNFETKLESSHIFLCSYEIQIPYVLHLIYCQRFFSM